MILGTDWLHIEVPGYTNVTSFFVFENALFCSVILVLIISSSHLFLGLVLQPQKADAILYCELLSLINLNELSFLAILNL